MFGKLSLHQAGHIFESGVASLCLATNGIEDSSEVTLLEVVPESGACELVGSVFDGVDDLVEAAE